MHHLMDALATFGSSVKSPVHPAADASSYLHEVVP